MPVKTDVTENKEIICFHCGDTCPNDQIRIDDKFFCCEGCKIVYEVLHDNDACNYYAMGEHPGSKQNEGVLTKKFDYLDDEEIRDKLIRFADDKISTISFFIPKMHCSSCVWLLEHLYKFNSLVVQSRVNFPNKQLSVTFKNELKLSDLVALLASLGYEPQISLEDLEKKDKKEGSKSLHYKLGVAGFCFGNIMLLSFPEYLGFDPSSENLREFFSYVIIALSLPVILYASSEYLISAWHGIKQRFVNIDVPLAIGIVTLYGRSIYEIFWQGGYGYMDSFSGLIFFLLLGKVFQSKTYEIFNFERDFKSYFPISVTKKERGEEKQIPLSKVKPGDRLVLRNKEIIPADSLLLRGDGNIDYSFVTGESTPVQKVLGEKLYAGGKQMGTLIEVEVVNDVSQSYLTRLWNDYLTGKFPVNKYTRISDVASKYFTLVVLLIAAGTFIGWLPANLDVAVTAFSSVLIVACPCALALSVPFTLGNTLRILGRNDFYLKNVNVIEQMAQSNVIVFDKTGTITEIGSAKISFEGEPLTTDEKNTIKSLVKNSTHPLSKIIYDNLDASAELTFENFEEKINKGLQAEKKENVYRLGSRSFCVGEDDAGSDSQSFEVATKAVSTKVCFSINGKVRGTFTIRNVYRDGISEVIASLRDRFEMYVLSGDNDSEKENLTKIFNKEENLLFNQSPVDKKKFIEKLQSEKNKVFMLGDGLNDVGALSQANIGVSVADNVLNFTPSSDGILQAEELKKLKKFICFARRSLTLITISFIISFIYNAVGITVAVQGLLSPLFAAILMPLSSISVVIFATVSTSLLAKKYKLL